MRRTLYGALALSILVLALSARGRLSTREPLMAVRGSSTGVPVLAYHYLRANNAPDRIVRSIGAVLLNLPLISPEDYWTVSAATFEKHLQYLKAHGYRTIPMRELIPYMRSERELEGRCAAITFDDGDESVYRIAYPLLKKYGMDATVFVITSHVGGSWNGIEFSSWPQLKEMKESGVMEVGSHTHDLHYKIVKDEIAHPRFAVIARGAGEEDMSRVLEDFRKSKREIEQRIGAGTVCLAWPFGFGTDLADSLACEAGYYGIMTLGPGHNKPGDSPYHVKRYTITAQTSLRSFESMVSGRSSL